MSNYPDIFSRPDFQRFFEAIPGVYLILNPDLSIREVSDTYVKATMTKRDEIVGKGIFTVFPESTETSRANSVKVVTDSFQKVLRDKVTDKIEHLRFDILNPDNKESGFETRYWSLASMPVLNADTGEADFIVTSVEDTTEVVRLKEIENQHNDRFLKIFNLSPDAKAIVSLHSSKFLYINQAFAKLMEWAVEEVIGKTSIDLDLIDEENRVKLRKIIEQRGNIRGEEIKLRAKSGRWVDVLLNIEIFELDGENCVMGNYIDITERKKTEEKILQLNKELEQHVIQLEQVNRELESFSYSVSHDLRAPLRAINGYAQILADDYSDKVDQDGATMINTIKRNATKMGQLIDDLLAFSRLGKKEVQSTAVNMQSVIQMVLTELKNTKVLSDNVEIDIQPMPAAQADQALMQQVWMNLISNAVKYSSKEAQPKVVIGAMQNNDNTVYYIKDNGVGFDMKYYDKLFGVFQRLHSAEEFEGTGVGLALIQRIIVKHKGKIWAEAEVNKGATFYFSLS